IARGSELVGYLSSLSVADLEHEKPRPCRSRDALVEADPEERAFRLVAELRLEPFERVDVRRVRDDEIPAGRGVADIAFAQLDVEAEQLGVFARERQRVGRDVDAHDVRILALILQRQSDRARADTDVEHARKLDPLE